MRNHSGIDECLVSIIVKDGAHVIVRYFTHEEVTNIRVDLSENSAGNSYHRFTRPMFKSILTLGGL